MPPDLAGSEPCELNGSLTQNAGRSVRPAVKAGRSIVLHIGVHKTGTTAIQRYLSEHGDQLEEAGFLFPKSERLPFGTAHFGHHLLARRFMGRTPAVGELDLLRTEIGASPAETLIFSSEQFSRFDLAGITLLQEALAMPMKVVFFYRRQSDLIQSIYQTLVTAFDERRGFPEFVESGEWRLDYLELARSWAAVVGKDNVVPRAYPSPGHPTDDSVTDFLDLIGLDRPKDYGGERVNVTPVASEMRRNLQQRGIPVASIPSVTSTDNARPSDSLRFMTVDEARLFDLRFAETNAAFQAAFCGTQPPIQPAGEAV